MPETLELPSGRELQAAVEQATESAQQWFSTSDNLEQNESSSSEQC